MNYYDICKDSLFGRRDIKINLDNSFEKRRTHKICNKKMIYETGLDNVTLKGRGNLVLTDDNILYHKSVLTLETNTNIENVFPRPSSTISFSLKHEDFSSYNYFGAYVYVKSEGYNGFYFHFMTGNEGHYTNHAPIIYPNTWQFVCFDATHIVRDDVNIFSITPYLMGTPPEALPEIKVYIDSIFAYNSDGVYDLGFNLQNRIAYCHSGYLINSTKEAIIENNNEKEFKIIGNKTYTFPTKTLDTEYGSFLILDFSEVTHEGIYKISCGGIESEEFVISNLCFHSSILKSLNFLRSLRCGEHVEGVHSKCHLNCRTYLDIDGVRKSVPNFGGWHDAGDVSQFEIPTAEISLALLELASTQTGELQERILEECKVGLDWLCQTRFKNGYRALAITYSIWRDNVLDDANKTIYTNPAERGAFENCLSAISFVKGYSLFKDKNETYAQYLLRLAKEDFDFAKYEYENDIYTVRWGKTITSQTLGALCFASSLLFETTNDIKYLKFSEENIRTVIKTQDNNPNNPLKGFFYEDCNHDYILLYEHRAHEEYPILGLISVYNITKDSELKKDIYNSINLYKSFIMNSLNYSKPYGLIPGYLYNTNKINIQHFTCPKNLSKEEALNYLDKQVKKGINVYEDFYLRLMPISFTRRGFSATQLSKTVAISAIANFLDDDDLRKCAIRQIEWTLGLNPFSSSLMYGEGYNYHNLYVAFSKQIVGSLPVGIMTKGDLDLPYWPDYTNAVFKEIWGHTTGKYLYSLTNILKGMK